MPDRFVARPTECEAMQWGGREPALVVGENGALEIVAWVNANGGEARYYPDGVVGEHPNGGPRIGVRTINGWAYAEPGHYVVMGTALFEVDHTAERGFKHLTCVSTVRDFYPCDPETFESRWVRA